MGPLEWIITYGCKLGVSLAYDIRGAEMKKIRKEGPLLLYANHTGMIEAPIIYTYLTPRKGVTALAKAEWWDKPFLRLVFTLWHVIPLRRGETDMEAMRKAIEALGQGRILGIAPEGTRNKTGKLIRAHAGITMLALHSKAPMQPIAHWGGEKLSSWKRLKRPVFELRVGRAFRLDPKGQKVTKEVRQEMADEIMYQLAKLLPEEYRGEYSDLSKATERWLAFED